MAKKGLSEKQLNDIKTMAINGVVPHDIAAALNIAVSTVHHHKKLMRDQGVNFPDVRGQRPALEQRPMVQIEVVADQSEIPLLYVNGVEIRFTCKPKALEIGEASIKIEY